MPERSVATDGFVQLWRDALGADADPTSSFLANGGDSFRAVVLSIAMLEAGLDVDYLDVLQAPSLPALLDVAMPVAV
jgi:hypothetical protein